jgi:protein-disulfide isomerase
MTLALRSLLATSIFALAGCAQAQAPDAANKAEIEEIVRAYLLENPEIIREALIELERKDQQAELDKTYDAIADLNDQIFRDPRDYAVGPKDAKVQIVEFFDYNCGFCKRSTDWVEETIAKHPDDVRFVFKELPVLTGPEGMSFTAARAALASARQGKYSKFHFAMMKERGLTEARILQIATNNGLDADQLKKDMEDPAIRRQIDDNLQLAQQIPALTGTPFFVINGQFISGASMPRLNAALREELDS